MIDCLLTRKEAIQCNGKIYSEEHRRKFEIKNNIFKVEKNPTDDSKLVLTINRQPISEWFKEQWEKLRQGLRQPTEEPRKVEDSSYNRKKRQYKSTLIVTKCFYIV